MGASFHEIQFPPDISYGATGGPGFKTTVLTLASGSEKRNIEWADAKAEYDVAKAVKTQQELNIVRQFFVGRIGKAYGFRFKDWSDYLLVDAGGSPPVILTTDGIHNTAQLIKVYNDPVNPYTRVITKPVPNTVQVWSNGGPLTFNTDFTVDTTTGIVTLSSGIASVGGRSITAACQFDVPVRFDTDKIAVKIDDFNSFSWESIPLVETREI